MKKPVVVFHLLLMSLFANNAAYALSDLDYPYFNDFESLTSLHDDCTDKNKGVGDK